MEELLKEIAKELAAQNKLTAVRIAKENLLSWGKSQEEIVEEMKTSTERIIKWGYSYPNENFPLDAPETTAVTIRPSKKNKLSE